VRERTKEIAVFKVLGFSKWQILVLVLGEGLLLGVVAGFCGSALTYLLINKVAGGIRIPLGWFPVFYVPAAALWWGPAVGALTARWPRGGGRTRRSCATARSRASAWRSTAWRRRSCRSAARGAGRSTASCKSAGWTTRTFPAGCTAWASCPAGAGSTGGPATR